MADLIVKVEQGELRGISNKSDNGKDYYSFLGIPFAEPPTGKLRFKEPVPVKPWNGIRDATKEGGVAAQIDMFTHQYAGGDDCLYLNVHTPQLKSSGGPALPVMVNIHGGGFLNGSGNAEKFGPEYIMEENTIVVTSNYRLGVMGFLCTDSVNARGDMGLFDQQMALQWVKKNIAAFNGDAENITLFGISAGSASVEYQMLSKKSHSCFHKAIMQSGSTLNIWSRTENAIEFAISLAKIFGYTSKGSEGLFDFLNQFETKDLVMASGKLVGDDNLKAGRLFLFTPVINEFKDNKGFLNDEPMDLLKRGEFHKVPTISGLCEKEGMMIKIFYTSEQFQNHFKNGEYIECVPERLNKNMENCDEKLKDLYRKRTEDKNPDDNVLDFLSDLSFNGGVFTSLEERLKHNPNNEYFYHFAYDGNLNMLKNILQFKQAGACHGDDHTYLASCSLVPKEKATPKDILVRNRMVKMWTNFAKCGNPTPKTDAVVNEKWIPITANSFNYMNISEDLKMCNDLCKERRELWKELYKNY